jgi:putative restriction endonuclease
VDKQDYTVRRAAFDWLERQVAIHGDVLPREILAQGFDWRGQRVPLLGPQGIFKPRVLDIPLSIVTIPSGPYDDGYSPEGLLLYRYRGEDPQHRDNVGLRQAMRDRIPLVYLYRVDKGKYLAVWPVFIVGDQPEALTFKVEVDDTHSVSQAMADQRRADSVEDAAAEARRAYITASVRQRVHQRSFRARVLKAYQEQCAMCRLRHEQLLDAAHIVPDTEPEGEPIVPNGLALCKLHHAAFDRQFLGIRPDYVIEVRQDILEEFDRPMLQHGLKEMHHAKLWVPRDRRLRPDSDLLALRYQEFGSATR